MVEGIISFGDIRFSEDSTVLGGCNDFKYTFFRTTCKLNFVIYSAFIDSGSIGYKLLKPEGEKERKERAIEQCRTER